LNNAAAIFQIVRSRLARGAGDRAAGCCAMRVRGPRPHDLKKRRRIVQASEAGSP